MKEGQVGICIETFIQGKALGTGDKRGFSSGGGTYRTSDRFTIDPTTGAVSGNQNPHPVGKTYGHFTGFGGVDHGVTSSDASGITVHARGEAMSGLGIPPYAINYDINLKVSTSGDVSLAGGSHDGYPSYEVWVYRAGAQPQLLYGHTQGKIWQLRPPAEITVPGGP